MALQVTVPPAPAQVQVQVGEARKVVPAGSVSESETVAALLGPALLAVMV